MSPEPDEVFPDGSTPWNAPDYMKKPSMPESEKEVQRFPNWLHPNRAWVENNNLTLAPIEYVLAAYSVYLAQGFWTHAQAITRLTQAKTGPACYRDGEYRRVLGADERED